MRKFNTVADVLSFKEVKSEVARVMVIIMRGIQELPLSDQIASLEDFEKLDDEDFSVLGSDETENEDFYSNAPGIIDGIKMAIGQKIIQFKKELAVSPTDAFQRINANINANIEMKKTPTVEQAASPAVGVLPTTPPIDPVVNSVVEEKPVGLTAELPDNDDALSNVELGKELDPLLPEQKPTPQLGIKASYEAELKTAREEYEGKKADAELKFKNYTKTTDGSSVPSDVKKTCSKKRQNELKEAYDDYLEEVGEIKDRYKGKKKEIESDYKKALGGLKERLKTGTPVSDGEKALYASAQKIMEMANAVKGHKIFSVLEETQAMTKILHAVDEALNDPTNPKAFEEAANLVDNAKFPVKTPLSKEYRIFLAVLAITAAIVVVAGIALLVAGSHGALGPVAAHMIHATGMALASTLSGLGFSAAGASITSALAATSTFFTATLPAFMVAPLVTMGIPLTLPPFVSGLVSGFIASAVSAITLLGVYTGAKAAIDYVQKPAAPVPEPVPLTTAFKEKAASLRGEAAEKLAAPLVQEDEQQKAFEQSILPVSRN